MVTQGCVFTFEKLTKGRRRASHRLELEEERQMMHESAEERTPAAFASALSLGEQSYDKARTRACDCITRSLRYSFASPQHYRPDSRCLSGQTLGDELASGCRWRRAIPTYRQNCGEAQHATVAAAQSSTGATNSQ